MIRLTVLALALLGAAASVKAQSAIDSVIEANAERADVETTYNEERDANRHKYRETVVMTFTNPELYRQFREAFDSERENTYQATRQRDRYIYRFCADGCDSSYVLIKEGEECTLIKRRSCAPSTSSHQDSEATPFFISFEF